MSDLVGNPEDWFSCVAAHMTLAVEDWVHVVKALAPTYFVVTLICIGYLSYFECAMLIL